MVGDIDKDAGVTRSLLWSWKVNPSPAESLALSSPRARERLTPREFLTLSPLLSSTVNVTGTRLAGILLAGLCLALVSAGNYCTFCPYSSEC